MAPPTGAGRQVTMTVDPSIFGLPGIAFGGYLAGVLAVAARSQRSTKVTFLAPAPLGRALAVQPAGEQTMLREGDTLLARLEPGTAPDGPPRLPEWAEAQACTAEFLDGAEITHPDCFGCGPARPPGTGLRVFTGLSARNDLVIAAWTPPEEMCRRGQLPTELVWAALDCPGAWARRRLGARDHPAVTASLTVDLRRPVRHHDQIVVVGWLIHSDHRKTWVGSSLISIDGRVQATAEALWIDIQPAPHG